MKVAIVHDDLVQWGGAERMLIALSKLFPEAPIYTFVFDKENLLLREKLSGKKIITSFVQKIPGWRILYRNILSVLTPLAFEQFDFSEYDLVISQTTRFAKSIITKPQTLHICYCHTPPRFLWNFSNEQVPWWLKIFLPLLKTYDRILSQRVDFWVAGSKNAKQRVQEVYGYNSVVAYPFIDPSRFLRVESFNGDYYLVISRLNRYKRVDLAVKAANRLKCPLKIVGVGPEEGYLRRIAGPNIDFLGNLSEELLTTVIAGCKAVIVSAEEDFGLTPLEAGMAGKPVVAYKKGGVLETVVEGETGYFFDNQSVKGLIEALLKLDKKGYNEKKCKELTSRFSEKVFTDKLKETINSIKFHER